MSASRTVDDRGLGKLIKHNLSPSLFRPMTIAYNKAVSLLPYELKYGLGETPRRRKYPYRVIESGDVVVQIGAPRDILSAGRSRAIHFARLVGSGKVVVIEPDPDNCRAFKAFLRANRLESRVILVEKGAWDRPGKLHFLSSPTHPAANVLVDAKEMTEALKKQRNYQVIDVDVETVDGIILRDLEVATPKLISITTNGAEVAILKGALEVLARGVPYVSLASTGHGYSDEMLDLGYEYLGRDDRGYMYRRK